MTPADTDLRDFKFMPLEVMRLRRSRAWLTSKRSPEIGFYMLNLWASAWHEVPAASLDDDDDVLADRAMCDDARWPEIRGLALRGWVKCSDGRLYHPVVAEIALRCWNAKLRWRARINRRLEIDSGLWDQIRAAVFKRDDFRCQYCNGKRGVKLECDHVVPRASGGRTELNNLVTACVPCNRSKGAKPLDQWLAERAAS